MTNSPTDPVFELVHCLTPAEKRYFKLFANRHVIGGKNNYCILFDALSEMRIYEESELEKKFKGEKMFSNFATTKYELTQIIFHSLHAFHNASSLESLLREQLHLAEIFKAKGKYLLADKIVQKGIKKTRALELFSLLASFSELRIKLIPSLTKQWTSGEGSEGLRKKIIAIHDLRLSSLEAEKNLAEFSKLKSEIDHLTLRSSAEKGKEFINLCKESLCNPLLKEGENALSYSAIGYQLNLKASVLYLLGETLQSIQIIEKLEQHLLSNPVLLNQNPELYISTLSKLLVYRTQANLIDGFREILSRLRSVERENEKKISQDLKLFIFTRGYFTELFIYGTLGDFSSAKQAMKEAENGLDNFGDNVPLTFRVSIWYTLAYLNFGQNNFSIALKWVNKIMNESDESMLPTNQSLARILSLLIHYELKNFDLLPYRVTSVYRFLLRNRTLSGLEEMILGFIRNAFPKANSPDSRQKAILNVYNQIKSLSKDSVVLQRTNSLNLLAWLESKLTEKSFEECCLAQRKGECVS